MKNRLLTTYILSLFDLACTLLLVQLYGISVEANPVGKLILTSPAGMVYKIVVIGALLYLLYCLRVHRLARIGINICLAVYSALALYHLIIIAALVV